MIPSSVPARPLIVGRMPRLLVAVVAAALFSAGLAARAETASDALLKRLDPQGYVSDYLGILSAAERGALEEMAAGLEQNTGAQLAVVILRSLEGGQIDDFTNKLFQAWGVGQRGKDKGVMLLVAIQDRAACIGVGYGLEPILPDALAGRVLDEQFFPAFKQGRYAHGLTLAVDRISQIVRRGEPAPADRKARGGLGLRLQVGLVLFLGLILFGSAAVIGSYLAGNRELREWGWEGPAFSLCVSGLVIMIGWLFVPWSRYVLPPFGLLMLALGWIGERYGADVSAQTAPRTSRSSSSGWRVARRRSGVSSGLGFAGRFPGGFGGGSSGGFGGFGAGRSGGGGASGRW